MPLRPPGRETRIQRALEAPLAEVRAEISQHFAAQERKAVGLVWAQLRTDQPEPSPSDDVMVMVRTVTRAPDQPDQMSATGGTGGAGANEKFAF